MISQLDYTEKLQSIGRKFENKNIDWAKWHEQYCYYEDMWEKYFSTFCNISTSREIKLVFWESCPGGMPFPHQNYAFDSNRFENKIHGTFDSYLRNECVRFQILWKKQKIGELLTELSKKGVLIIDLYPTHGVSLDTTNRKCLFERVFGNYSLNKLTVIGDKLKYRISPCIKVTNELSNAGINDDSMRDEIKIAIQNALHLPSLPNFYI